MILNGRVVKLEKKVASLVRNGPFEGQSMYQPSEAELAEALVILVECGAARQGLTTIGQSTVAGTDKACQLDPRILLTPPR